MFPACISLLTSNLMSLIDFLLGVHTLSSLIIEHHLWSFLVLILVLRNDYAGLVAQDWSEEARNIKFYQVKTNEYVLVQLDNEFVWVCVCWICLLHNNKIFIWINLVFDKLLKHHNLCEFHVSVPCAFVVEQPSLYFDACCILQLMFEYYCGSCLQIREWQWFQFRC